MWREREREIETLISIVQWKKKFVVFFLCFVIYPIRRIVDSCSLFQYKWTQWQILAGFHFFVIRIFFCVGFFWEEMKNDREGYNKRFKIKKEKLGYIYYESYLSNTKRFGFTSLFDFNCSPLQLLNEKTNKKTTNRSKR